MIEATKSWLAGAICAAALAGPAGKAAAQAEFEWVRSYTGALIPGGAYVGGQEDGTPLLICRAPYLGGIYPGKLVKGNCNISYDSKEIYLHDFDILVGQGGQWAPPQPGLAGAFIAGYERGGPLFLCQAMYSGGLHPGKIYDGKCDISYAGREIPIRRFNVFYIGAQTVETAGGAPYPPTVIYQSHTNIQNNTTTTTIVKKVYVAPPAYDASAVAAAAAARQRAQDAARAQALQDQRDREDQARQKAEYQRNQDAQKAAAEAAAAQARAEGEAEENRQALTAQAQAEDQAKAQAQATEEEAKKQAEIRKGEEEENRMAAEAAAKAQAEEDARKQEEIKRGEEEENRMAAEAEAKTKAEEPPPPSESPPKDEPSPN